jgi:hypothetical protein
MPAVRDKANQLQQCEITEEYDEIGWRHGLRSLRLRPVAELV